MSNLVVTNLISLNSKPFKKGNILLYYELGNLILQNQDYNTDV